MLLYPYYTLLCLLTIRVGYCKDYGVPPGYKGCAREDAHDLPVRREAMRGVPRYGSSLDKRDDDPANYDYYYLDSYVSTVFPTEFAPDSTVVGMPILLLSLYLFLISLYVVYYQGYVDEGHVCGGLVDHIIITPHFNKCVELCEYGLHFFCEMPQFLNASGAPVSTPSPTPLPVPHHDTGKEGHTVSFSLSPTLSFLFIISFLTK